MGSRRKSVFERLGPLPADAPSPPPLPAEQQAQGVPKQRVALAHPLVARHLMLAQSRQGGLAGGGPPGLQGPAAQQQQGQQPKQQQQRRRRQRHQPHERQRGSSASSAEGPRHRQQRDRSRGSQEGLQDELQRLQAERDAAEEMLGQMAAQTQSLLADKAALQQQAAKLEALACALQERLDFLLLEEDSQEWDSGEGLLPDLADSERGGSYGSSAAQPSTPSATYVLPDAVSPALHSRLGALAAEQQQQLRVAAAHGAPSSRGTSGPPSSSSSPSQAAPAADE